MAERFWDYVDKTGDCWVWTRYRKPSGYGLTYVGQEKVLAHRFAYELAVGPIPPGMFVCHHCDNPPCVRPDHLFLGTPLDNTRDMDAKGRRVARVLTDEGRMRLSVAMRNRPHYTASWDHCPNGHPYSEENTYRYRGGRRCRECGRARGRRSYAKRVA